MHGRLHTPAVYGIVGPWDVFSSENVLPPGAPRYQFIPVCLLPGPGTNLHLAGGVWRIPGELGRRLRGKKWCKFRTKQFFLGGFCQLDLSKGSTGPSDGTQGPSGVNYAGRLFESSGDT